MHELGVLRQIVRTVEDITVRNSIDKVAYIALEVGRESGVVPLYLHKLFPVAVDSHPLLQHTELRVEPVDGAGLVIKELGY